MTALLGIVLCGGQSSRMGSDKGLLPVDDTIWAKRVGERLTVLPTPVLYSINEQQVPAYSQHIPPAQLVVDAVPVPGPLRGLFTLHQQYPEHDLLLLACDMLQVTSGILKTLHHTWQQGGYDYYAFHDGRFYQTFCAIYTAKALATAWQALCNGQDTNYSFQHLLQQGLTCRLPVVDAAAFANYNHPSPP